MTNNIVFIGGPADGMREALLPKPSYFYVPVADSERSDRPEVMRYEYRLEYLYGGNGQAFPVYVAADSTVDPTAMLIDGYRKGNAKPQRSEDTSSDHSKTQELQSVSVECVHELAYKQQFNPSPFQGPGTLNSYFDHARRVEENK